MGNIWILPLSKILSTAAGDVQRSTVDVCSWVCNCDDLLMSPELHVQCVWPFKFHHFVLNKRMVGNLAEAELQGRINYRNRNLPHFTRRKDTFSSVFAVKNQAIAQTVSLKKRMFSFISGRGSWIWNFTGQWHLLRNRMQLTLEQPRVNPPLIYSPSSTSVVPAHPWIQPTTACVVPQHSLLKNIGMEVDLGSANPHC